MANNNLAAIPELWSREGLRILTEQAPAVMSVNRQFENEVARFGNVVHAHRPARRKIRRKTGADQFTATDTTLENVDVKLDQWFYDSFLIKDDEMALSLVSLEKTHLVPAIQTIARGVDRAILGRVHAFLQQGSPRKRAGKLLGMSKTNSADYILEAQEALLTNNAPAELVDAIVHQTTQTFLQGNELFASAEKRGSSETLTTGRIGQIYNTNIIMSQNANYVYEPNADIEKGTVATGGGQAAGYAGAIAVTADFAHTLVVGEFFVCKENGQPTYITATNGTTSVTLNEELKFPILAASEVVSYFKCTSEAVERTAGYQKEMVFTHTSGKNLQVGQMLAFGTGTSRHTYTVIEIASSTATTTTVLLDRPLDATVAASADAFPGPAGAINPVLHRDALAFVSRPLAIPGNEFGVMSAVQQFNGLGLRVTMQYDSKEGGMRVNLDLLAGIAALDTNLMVALLS